MRTIKFRAYLKGVGMFNVMNINFQDEYVELKTLQGEPYGAFNLNDVDLLQFTGLYDKNGKDIYEGDLLINEGKGSKPREVVFKNGVFCIRLSGGYGRLYQWEINELGKEIIGNIHENTNLEQ